MPSEDSRLDAVLTVLAQPLAEFRTALADALAQAEAQLAEASADPATRIAHAAASLGRFAAGRLRPEAFVAVTEPPRPADGTARSALKRAIAVLRRLVERGNEALIVRVPAGADLAAHIGGALEQIGRGFGAVMLAELVRGGRYRPESHDSMLESSEFREWSRVERTLTPPLIALLDGADLNAAGLAGFCDGRTRLVLLVSGECAPAPLVRLITPGTLVLQTTDTADLDGVARCTGPAVAALLPPGTARFRHDPAGGSEPWQRLSVLALPEPPRKPVGGISAWQMAEDLKQLATLARTPFVLPSAEGAGERALGSAAAVQRLEAWLLQ